MKRTKALQRYLGNASTPGAIVAALAFAALLGAVHALTTGHGKTIAGAYPVGEHATVRHALILGASTTITHTASVLALGAITIGLSDRVDTRTLNSGLRWFQDSSCSASDSHCWFAACDDEPTSTPTRTTMVMHMHMLTGTHIRTSNRTR